MAELCRVQGGDDAHPVYAIQRPEEALGFLQRVERRRPRVVVEIGTAAGGFFFLLSRVAAGDALLVSIDLPAGRGGYRRWRTPVYRRFARKGQEVLLLRGNSRAEGTQNALRRALDGRRIDLLFVDGDHSREGVLADLRAYGPMVDPGGWIALHDIVRHQGDPSAEVWALWRELREQPGVSEHVARWDDERGYGIGVLEMSEPLREWISGRAGRG